MPVNDVSDIDQIANLKKKKHLGLLGALNWHKHPEAGRVIIENVAKN